MQYVDGAAGEAAGFPDGLRRRRRNEPVWEVRSAAMVSGDFDGGGTDLAISAPSSGKVYVFLNVNAGSGANTPGSSN